ncbi:hypothetical protein MKZ74_12650 [Staphylococcus haemolyticus]|uniref:hypothetical protein n=1 Tax=Staphylococcus haemolyticus TaxID=1283 RepID=UPI001F5D72CB|nr:hypothetical protein [Staphylococcus haemolyticus]MCI3140194.1 hypothetical protein [Staphylococcus haemolyticus]
MFEKLDVIDSAPFNLLLLANSSKEFLLKHLESGELPYLFFLSAFSDLVNISVKNPQTAKIMTNNKEYSGVIKFVVSTKIPKTITNKVNNKYEIFLILDFSIFFKPLF